MLVQEKTTCIKTTAIVKLTLKAHHSLNIPINAALFDVRGQLLAEGELNEKNKIVLKRDLKKPMDLELFVGLEEDPRHLRRSAAYNKSFKVRDWITTQRGRWELMADVTIPRRIWRLWIPLPVKVTGKISQKNNLIQPIPFAKVEIYDVDRSRYPVFLESDREPLERVARELRTGPYSPALELPGADQNNLHLPGDQEKAVNTQTAPWELCPIYYYRVKKLKTVFTDNEGCFRADFDWFSYEHRYGTLIYDGKPDIILKVIQEINGEETSYFMDPRKKIHWNEHDAHIDLVIESDQFKTGRNESYEQPSGQVAGFSRVGDDKVEKIDRETGLYSGINSDGSSYVNMAYAQGLALGGVFGKELNAAHKRYYKISVGNKPNGKTVSYHALINTITDVRVDKSNGYNEHYLLGPHTIGSEKALYEMRDFQNYLWYNPDLLGIWPSKIENPNSGLYHLKLEVYDETGKKLDENQVDYLDNEGNASTYDYSKLAIQLDHHKPEATLEIPLVDDICNVVTAENSPLLKFNIDVSQAHNRLMTWVLKCDRGHATGKVASDHDVSGNLGHVTKELSGEKLVKALDHSCMVRLCLTAVPHIRNGYGSVFHVQDYKTFFIEKK